MPGKPSVGQSQAPLTSPCPPSNHTITLNLTLTFAASWFGHASHVGQKFASGTFGARGASGAFDAHGLLRLAPLTTKCWPEAPWGGGGSWRPRTHGVAPSRGHKGIPMLISDEAIFSKMRHTNALGPAVVVLTREPDAGPAQVALGFGFERALMSSSM